MAGYRGGTRLGATLLLVLMVAQIASTGAEDAKPAPKQQAKSKIIPTAGETELPNGLGDVLPSGARACSRCCCSDARAAAALSSSLSRGGFHVACHQLLQFGSLLDGRALDRQDMLPGRGGPSREPEHTHTHVHGAACGAACSTPHARRPRAHYIHNKPQAAASRTRRHSARASSRGTAAWRRASTSG